MISRAIESRLKQYITGQKIILLFGARQVGKTTLLENADCLKPFKTLFLNGDESDTKELLSNPNSIRLKYAFENYQLVIIDEAQEIENIGTCLKIINDKLKEVKVIATGSSAFELANRANEPLTGRKFELMLYPFTFAEMVQHNSFIEELRMIDFRLIYGYYPEVVNNPANEPEVLKLIANSYLYKDILRLEQIKKSSLLEKVLKALALQIGNEVSYNEIAQLCNTDNKTIERYIDVLEKAYIIIILPAYNKNIRNEIKKGKKIYFWDNGIRNAVLGNYTPIQSRTDAGALWENFLVSERLKQNRYLNKSVNSFFWRTTQQQEIDYIEETPDGFHVFEFKLNPRAKAKLPRKFEENYKVLNYYIINKENIETFLLEE
jgi:predicted AAA+ superfamily ATPase